MKQIQYLLFAAVSLFQFNTHEAMGARYHVEFSGQITVSGESGNNNGQFADFAAGTPFHGEFLFDSDLITGSDSLTGTAGTFRRYSSAIRDYKVEFQLQNGVYTYEPPVFGAGQFATRSLTLWNVVDDFTAQTLPATGRDELQVRVQNYPAQSAGGPSGIPIGTVPQSQYVNGLYPHSSFFELTNYIEPLDGVSPPNELVDVSHLYANSDSQRFSIRFTDANEPSWVQGAETIYASLHGNITEVIVTVPEPSAAILASCAGLVLLWKRRSSLRAFP